MLVRKLCLNVNCAQSELLRKAEEAVEKAKQDEQAKERKRKNIDLD